MLSFQRELTLRERLSDEQHVIRRAQGFLDAADLTKFAERNGLPSSYVSAFMGAVNRGADNQRIGCAFLSKGHARPASDSCWCHFKAVHVLLSKGCAVTVNMGLCRLLLLLVCTQAIQCQSSTLPGSVRVLPRSFERFAGFVRGREESLRRTYDVLDADGNGELTGREVEAGLAHICFTCPTTRCQYRSRPEARPAIVCNMPVLLVVAGYYIGSRGNLQHDHGRMRRTNDNDALLVRTEEEVLEVCVGLFSRLSSSESRAGFGRTTLPGQGCRLIRSMFVARRMLSRVAKLLNLCHGL